LWKKGDRENSFKVFNSSKTFLQFLPTEIKKLAQIEFNIGVSLQESKEFVESIKWLQDSYEIYEKDSEKDVAKQSNTLRLLCSSFIEIQNLESALSCIQMANKLHSTTDGLYLQLKLFVKKGFEEESRSVLMGLLSDSGIPLEM
jgi:tetratricopeptide (TPR) repeat protein